MQTSTESVERSSINLIIPISTQTTGTNRREEEPSALYSPAVPNLIILTVVLLSVLLAVAIGLIRRRLKKFKTEIDSSFLDRYRHIYEPLAAGPADEYDNTFVGVSVPLLQDNTKI
ncbi:unnamed protein product [Dimorphilus gyrociliatus]|uniref:Uncharacterized protein n=1 Tax=Dimorphilus gyrociliatus TaxID=2664684 RepID=A0A7I8VCY6_9ANNE|nr:unnamed protein product [Dimorphilus gyrociliatus]